MNIAEMIRSFDDQNVKVYIGRSVASYTSDESRWNVDITRDDGEAKIEISIYASTFEEAITRAYARFIQVSTKGLPLKALPSPTASGSS